MRSAIFLVILLTVPQIGGAQESLPGSRTHTVAPGETLGGIAQRYLGSAGEWRRVLEANRDRISNPDLIRPGMELVIPGGSTAPAGANVLGFQSGGTALGLPNMGSYDARRASLAYGTFGVSASSDIALDSRTVFYEEASVSAGSAVIVPRKEDSPALQESSFHAAAWIIPENDRSDRLGEVAGFAIAGTRPPSSTALFPGDHLQLRFDGGTPPQVGEEFISYGIRREIPGVGAVATPTGRLRITGGAGSVATAEIVAMYDPMRIGDSLARVRAFPLEAGVHPAPTTAGGEARIIAFEASQEIYLPGDFAFLDRGADAGVAVGDEMVAVVPGTVSPDAGIARFQVIRVRPGGATVRVISVETSLPLRPGLVLTTDRKMP
jgi:hypothetical protein